MIRALENKIGLVEKLLFTYPFGSKKFDCWKVVEIGCSERRKVVIQIKTKNTLEGMINYS